MGSAFNVLVVISVWLLYRLLQTLYNVSPLHPLSGFPGPKLAAATKLYEAYHVLIKNDWLENLIELHETYG